MQWKPNDKCLAGNRRAIIMKIHQGGRRATLSVCNGKDGGEILNWQRESFPIKELEPYPDSMPAGFWWDDRGFLCYPSLPVPREDDSPNIPSGENQISQASMTDTKNAPGELWEYAPADLTGFPQATLQDALRIAGQLRKPALLKLRNFIDERIAILDEQLEEKDVPVKSGRQIVRTLVAGSVVYRQEKVSCGKPTCNSCPHGPYWYSYQRVTGRVKSKYLGKNL